MSDEPKYEVPLIPLMSALKARDLGRAYQGWAGYLRGQGITEEAQVAEQRAQFFLSYAAVLSRVPPGATEEGW